MQSIGYCLSTLGLHVYMLVAGVGMLVPPLTLVCTKVVNPRPPVYKFASCASERS